MTLTWHPIHSSLLSTGGADGSLHHYLLDEPNAPDTPAPTLSPYDTPDPANAPTQSIFPAHKLPHAHESAIWALDWHPLGHILASGSNDRITRFWTRSRPGDTDYARDRYHLGDAAADAQGGYAGHKRKAHARDEDDDEDGEEADEEDGLVDQKMPAQRPGLPGLPGMMLPPGPTLASATARGDGTSTGGAQLNVLPGISSNIPPPASSYPYPPVPPPLDARGVPDLAALFKQNGGAIPPPPIPGTFVPPPLPPPPLNGAFPHGFPPPPLPVAGGLPVPPPMGFPGMQQQGFAGGEVGGNDPRRKRAPLPSQADSLREFTSRGGGKR